MHSSILTLIMLSQYISRFKNNVEPDQLASEKPADQILHCFHSACKNMNIHLLQNHEIYLEI